ncbi:hypothetical protein DID75_03510 [Candidatus Marinamargulisbacteria bacterium SCGC AG-410-N11]|nr:hypothetical protein DID75_03510 [Candidatus Marinamargulisbacteria bacterium SCGC AG-410-N11]
MSGNLNINNRKVSSSKISKSEQRDANRELASKSESDAIGNKLLKSRPNIKWAGLRQHLQDAGITKQVSDVKATTVPLGTVKINFSDGSELSITRSPKTSGTSYVETTNTTGTTFSAQQLKEFFKVITQDKKQFSKRVESKVDDILHIQSKEDRSSLPNSTFNVRLDNKDITFDYQGNSFSISKKDFTSIQPIIISDNHPTNQQLTAQLDNIDSIKTLVKAPRTKNPFKILHKKVRHWVLKEHRGFKFIQNIYRRSAINSIKRNQAKYNNFINDVKTQLAVRSKPSAVDHAKHFAAQVKQYILRATTSLAQSIEQKMATFHDLSRDMNDTLSTFKDVDLESRMAIYSENMKNNIQDALDNYNTSGNLRDLKPIKDALVQFSTDMATLESTILDELNEPFGKSIGLIQSRIESGGAIDTIGQSNSSKGILSKDQKDLKEMQQKIRNVTNGFKTLITSIKLQTAVPVNEFSRTLFIDLFKNSEQDVIPEGFISPDTDISNKSFQDQLQTTITTIQGLQDHGDPKGFMPTRTFLLEQLKTLTTASLKSLKGTRHDSPAPIGATFTSESSAITPEATAAKSKASVNETKQTNASASRKSTDDTSTIVTQLFESLKDSLIDQYSKSASLSEDSKDVIRTIIADIYNTPDNQTRKGLLIQLKERLHREEQASLFGSFTIDLSTAHQKVDDICTLLFNDSSFNYDTALEQQRHQQLNDLSAAIDSNIGQKKLANKLKQVLEKSILDGSQDAKLVISKLKSNYKTIFSSLDIFWEKSLPGSDILNRSYPGINAVSIKEKATDNSIILTTRTGEATIKSPVNFKLDIDRLQEIDQLLSLASSKENKATTKEEKQEIKEQQRQLKSEKHSLKERITHLATTNHLQTIKGAEGSTISIAKQMRGHKSTETFVKWISEYSTFFNQFSQARLENIQEIAGNPTQELDPDTLARELGVQDPDSESKQLPPTAAQTLTLDSFLNSSSDDSGLESVNSSDSESTVSLNSVDTKSDLEDVDDTVLEFKIPKSLDPLKPNHVQENISFAFNELFHDNDQNIFLDALSFYQDLRIQFPPEVDAILNEIQTIAESNSKIDSHRLFTAWNKLNILKDRYNTNSQEHKAIKQLYIAARRISPAIISPELKQEITSYINTTFTNSDSLLSFIENPTNDLEWGRLTATYQNKSYEVLEKLIQKMNQLINDDQYNNKSEVDQFPSLLIKSNQLNFTKSSSRFQIQKAYSLREFKSVADPDQSPYLNADLAAVQLFQSLTAPEKEKLSKKHPNLKSFIMEPSTQNLTGDVTIPKLRQLTFSEAAFSQKYPEQWRTFIIHSKS